MVTGDDDADYCISAQWREYTHARLFIILRVMYVRDRIYDVI